ncbi:MAG: type II secretion system protein [Kiritimatiellia bacterium]
MRNRNSFTLIELIAVFAIISFLAALLIGAVNVARRRSRLVSAKSEVRNIDAAWKQYYAHYRKWPSFVTNEANAISLTGTAARLLHGENTAGDNPHEIKFIEFQRWNPASNPVNPWADKDSPSAGDYYYARFDADYDNVIDAGAGIPPSNAVRRSVIVWTTNAYTTNAVGSWQ